MAEIEKGLPNTRTKIDVPSDEEIAQEVAVQEPEDQKGLSVRLRSQDPYKHLIH